MATFSDNFNRANGLIGSNWAQATGTNTWSVSSNQAKGTNFSIPTAVVSVATGTASFTADHEATVTITALGSQDRLGPAVRVDSAAATGYCIAVDGTSDSTRRIARFSGSGRTVIGTVNLSAAVNDVFTLRAVGSTISLFKNGSLVESVTDSTYTTGQPGMYYQMNNSGVSLVDAFSAQDVGGTTYAFDNQAFATTAFSVDAWSLEDDGALPPAVGGFRLRRGPRGGQ